MEQKGATINNLNDLESIARDAAQQLSKANSRNAILDKAAKSLRQGLADVGKARAETNAVADKADETLARIDEAYDADALQPGLDARAKVGERLAAADAAVTAAENAAKRGRDAAAAAKAAYDASAARFDEAQKKLLGLAKTIRDKQAQVKALETQVKDALQKQQVTEVALKGRDLDEAVADLRRAAGAEHERELWRELSAAVDDLLQKADAQAAAQAELATAEEALAAAKAKRDEAVKGRVEAIKAAAGAAAGAAR